MSKNHRVIGFILSFVRKLFHRFPAGGLCCSCHSPRTRLACDYLMRPTRAPNVFETSYTQYCKACKVTENVAYYHPKRKKPDNTVAEFERVRRPVIFSPPGTVAPQNQRPPGRTTGPAFIQIEKSR